MSGQAFRIVDGSNLRWPSLFRIFDSRAFAKFVEQGIIDLISINRYYTFIAMAINQRETDKLQRGERLVGIRSLRA